jgi:hypothetical protein
MLTFDTVRELGGVLSDVVDGTAYGAPALKLKGKLLACVPTNKSAGEEGEAPLSDLLRRPNLVLDHILGVSHIDSRFVAAAAL